MSPPGERSGRFAGNAAWLIVGDAFAKIASFAFVVVLARGLTKDDYGNFNFAISFVPLFLSFTIWGLHDILVREVARRPERAPELVGTVFGVRLAFATLAAGVAVAVAPAFLDTRDAFLAFVAVAAALVADEAGNVVAATFKALEWMRFRAVRIIVNRLVTMALAVIAIALGAGLVTVAVMYLLGSLAAFVYGWVTLRRHLPGIRLLDVRWDTARPLLRRGAPLALASAMSMAVFRIDAVMLQAMEGPAAVAVYGVAYRFLDSTLFVSWGLAGAALPGMARIDDPRRRGRTFGDVIALCLLVYLPLAAGAPFAIGWVIEKVFGARYAEADVAAAWLLAAAVAYACTYVARTTLLALNERRAIAAGALAALVFNVGANLLAIPRYGYEGAAAVTFATGVLELAVLGTVVLRRLPVGEWRLIAVPIAASAALAALLAATGLQAGAAVLVGSLAYLLLVTAGLRTLPSDSRARLRNLARRRGPAAGAAS